MGTRNLTMVIYKEQPKIAQYAQWDGYPEGQGLTILDFLKNVNIEKFKERIEHLEFFNEEELETINNDKNWVEKYPYLSRDLGGKILQAVYNNYYEDDNIFPKNLITCKIEKLVDNSDFAADSLFCEWAYVIDLDKNTFEVYEGFNKIPLNENERFYKLKPNKEYYPVKLAKCYELNNLPDQNDFLKDFEKEE